MTRLSRRHALAGLAAITAAPLTVRFATAQTAGPFKLDPLPYANNALEPHIDAKTMEIHHDKHHAAYVNNLNAALEGKGLPEQSIEDLCRNIDGGHANHSLFWTIMCPKGGGKPGGDLAKAIDAELGGFDKVKENLTKA